MWGVCFIENITLIYVKEPLLSLLKVSTSYFQTSLRNGELPSRCNLEHSCNVYQLLVKPRNTEVANMQEKFKTHWSYHKPDSYVDWLVLNSSTITEQRANRNYCSLLADRLSDLCRTNIFALHDFWHIDFLEPWSHLTASFKTGVYGIQELLQ